MSAVTFLTRTRGRRALDWTDWLSYVYLALGLFLMFGPVLWLVMSSFKTASALTEFPPSFLPYGQKQVMVPGEDKPSPVYRVKLPDGSVRELPELRRIGLMATHVDPAKPDELIRVRMKTGSRCAGFTSGPRTTPSWAASSPSAAICERYSFIANIKSAPMAD